MVRRNKRERPRNTPARHSSSRRATLALLCFILLCCAVWWGIELLVQVDRYRPLVVSKLEEATGMKASIEELDLALRPLPALILYGVSLGDDDFKLAAPHVTIRARLRNLLQKRLDITEIAFGDLDLTVPGDIEALKARFAVLHLASGPGSIADPGQSGIPFDAVTLDEIRVGEGRLHVLGAAEEVYAEQALYSFALELHDVLSDVISIDVRGTLERQGVAARLNANGVASRTPDWHFDGVINLSEGDTRMAPELPPFPHSKVDMQVALKDAPLANPLGAVSGKAEFDALPSFAGSFTAQASIEGGALAIKEFQWDSPAVTARLELSAVALASTNVRIQQLDLTPEGIKALAALAPATSFRIEPQEDAAFAGKDIVVDTTPEGAFRLAAGNGAFGGVEVVLPDGTKPFGEIAGRFEVNDWVFTADVSCEGVALKGLLTPDLAEGRVAVDLSGTAELNRDRLARMLALDAFTETKGTLHFQHIRGTFDTENALPPDLAIDGRLSNGTFAVKTASFADTWSAVEATFAASPGAIETHVRAESLQQGPLEIQGRYDVAARTWQGQVNTDIERFGHIYSGSPETRRILAAALDAYGSSQFRVTMQLPSEKEPGLSMAFERASAPPLSGSVEFAHAEKGWSLRASRVDAEIPLATFAPLTPKLVLDGVASLTLASSEEDAFVLDVDLSQGTIKTERHIEKKAGIPLTIRLAGTAWTPQTLQIACLGESAEGRFENGRLQFDNLDLSFEPLAALLVHSGAVNGRVAGIVATSPTTLDLILQDVTLGLSPELTLASVNGRVGYESERWSIDDLTLRGAQSDCTINAKWHGNQCEGEIRGEQLDVNALLELYHEAEAFQLARETQTDSTTTSSRPEFQSRFAVLIGTTHYKRAHIQEARASLVVSNEGLRLEDFTGMANGGLLSGEATVSRTADAPTRSLKVNLSGNGVDASLLDEVFFSESREFKGQLAGTAAIETRIGSGINPWAGLTGTVVVDGSHGTFGKLGLATKVLTVLRTTEIVRLRLPSLKDEGLRFTSLRSRLSAKDGLVTLEEFDLKNPSLEMKGTGTFDFPNDQSDVRLAVNVLEAVTGLAEKVPFVGRAAGKIGEIASVNLHITGPPLNPAVSVAPGERPPAEKAVNAVKGVAKTGEKAGRGLKDRTEGAIRGILGGSEKEKNKEE